MACEVGLELLESVKCPFKLNDNTHLSGPWSDSVEWLEQTWLPRAMRAGIKYLAHVASKDSFGEISGEVMRVSKIGQELYYQMFATKGEALAWLKECQEKYQQPAF